MSANPADPTNTQSSLPRWRGDYRPARPTVFARIDAQAIRTTMNALDGILLQWFDLRQDAYMDRTDAKAASTVPYEFTTGAAFVRTRQSVQTQAQSLIGLLGGNNANEFMKTDAAYRDAMRFLCAAEAMITVGLQYRLALYQLAHAFNTVRPITANLTAIGKALLNDGIVPWIEAHGERAFSVPTIANGIRNMLSIFDLAFEFEGPESCTRAGHYTASAPLTCAACIVDAVNNNAVLGRVDELYSNSGDRVMPPSHQSARSRFQAYAPHGYTTAMVPGQGMISGFQALLYSMREQYPTVPQPTIQELTDVLNHPGYKTHIKAYGFSDPIDFPHMDVDRLGAILLYWGRRNGANMQLGYIPTNYVPQLIPHPNSNPTVIVWIYSDDIANSLEPVENTFRGVRFNQPPPPMSAGVRFLQDLLGPGAQSSDPNSLLPQL